MSTPVCANCRHIQVRVDMDSGTGYWCLKRRRPLSGPFLLRPACREFSPEPDARAGR